MLAEAVSTRCEELIRATAGEHGWRIVSLEVLPGHVHLFVKCGHVAAGNRVSQAEFRCLSCGYSAHADENAAQNILRAGLARQVAQAA